MQMLFSFLEMIYHVKVYYQLENYLSNIPFKSPRGQSLIDKIDSQEYHSLLHRASYCHKIIQDMNSFNMIISQ